ncbi:MAG: RepB family plasmid replication initiator protein [Sphingobacteriaceae bacterium]|nr:MAG: RepB family plasmid replication initiator protein [Sphingobacteriaceae bacterium]
MKGSTTVTRETAKKKVPIMLPEVMTKIYQPNRITQAHLPLTLMQAKIFAYIMMQLQEPIKANMSGSSIDQLEIFSHPDYIKVPIHLNELISDSSNYRHVRQAVKDLASVVVAIPYKDAQGKGMERITGLIRADIPTQATGSSVVIIEIDKRVAQVLINVDKNTDNLPINYTMFYFEIVARAKSQYTGRLYPLIASWRKKGGFSIPMEDLKDFLSISDKYSRFYDFKKKVLDPVQKDLYEKSDCWFNCDLKGFKTIEKGKVMLNFKVITPEFKIELDKQDDRIIFMLKNYHFSESQLNEVKEILKSTELNRNLFVQRISEIDDFIYKNNQDPAKVIIESKPNYMFKALLKQFEGYKPFVN